MARSAVMAQVARLVAAFPVNDVPESSVALYAEELSMPPFEDADVEAAVTWLIRFGKPWFPSLPAVREEVWEHHRRRVQQELYWKRQALPESTLTEEERDRNRKKIASLARRWLRGRRIPDEETA